MRNGSTESERSEFSAELCTCELFRQIMRGYFIMQVIRASRQNAAQLQLTKPSQLLAAPTSLRRGGVSTLSSASTPSSHLQLFLPIRLSVSTLNSIPSSYLQLILFCFTALCTPSVLFHPSIHLKWLANFHSHS